MNETRSSGLPMRFDPDLPGQSPSMETFGKGQQAVRNGDWIIHYSFGRYSVLPDDDFRERFLPE